MTEWHEVDKVGGWIQVAERLPRPSEFPVWVYAVSGERRVLPRWGDMETGLTGGVTHWRRIEVPAPPERE
jgi:hypothetical protein